MNLLDKIQSASIFDIEAIERRIEELKHLPEFKPEKHEATFTVTQLFEDGIEATLYFVIRNNELIFYKAIKRVVPLHY